MNSTPSSRELNILLVESNQGDIRLVQEAFKTKEGEGCKVATSPLLRPALDMISREKFDAILVSLFLPDSPGVEALVQIRKTHPDVPILVLNGVKNEKMESEARAHGARGVFPKDKLWDGSLIQFIRESIR